MENKFVLLYFIILGIGFYVSKVLLVIDVGYAISGFATGLMVSNIYQLYKNKKEVELSERVRD